MAGDCSGKVWLITGCSSGFGRLLAEKALLRGDKVVVTARDHAMIREFSDRFGAAALCLRLDITDPASVRAALAAAFEQFGRIDILVNNAGFGIQAAVEEPGDAQIRHMFEVNFFGALDVIRAALPRLRQQNGAHIVNISSVAGRISAPLIALYSASKFAIEGLSWGLGLELAPFGIKVTTIEPGAFDTGFAAAVRLPDAELPAYADAHAFTREILGGMKFSGPGGCIETIFLAVDAPTPPRQLVAGGLAHSMVEQALADQVREMAEWREISIAADAA